MRRQSVNTWIVGAAVLAVMAVMWRDLARDKFTAVIVILTLLVGLVAVNLQWPRKPSLTLFYRVAGTRDQNILPAADQPIEVWIKNTGKGVAEAMEAEFGTLGGRIDHPELLGYPITEVGPGVTQQWHGRGRVLNPDQEIVLVTLYARAGKSGSRWESAPDKLEWKTRAKGMDERSGTIQMRDPTNR